jgi:hypothetical protein
VSDVMTDNRGQELVTLQPYSASSWLVTALISSLRNSAADDIGQYHDWLLKLILAEHTDRLFDSYC